ncbi:MAG: DUF2589 domain-containing protein [Pseudomonadota bacterium]
MADEISNSLTSLPMEFLIGAPLSASVKAQRELGMEMVNLVNLLAYGEENAKPGSPVKTLDMTLERPVQKPDGSIDSTTVQVKPPLLSLVPVPALLIDSVDINFSMEIHTVEAEKDTSSKEAMAEASAGGGWGVWHADVKATGKIATTRENTRSTDKTAKYDVTVRANQQEPTEGMSRLMDLLASTVEPIKATPSSS